MYSTHYETGGSNNMYHQIVGPWAITPAHEPSLGLIIIFT